MSEALLSIGQESYS